jgi:hypothetical protein
LGVGSAAFYRREAQHVRLGGFAHVNTAESFRALIKHAVYGTYHAASEHRLQRYVTEAAFKWNTRKKLGFNDTDRAEILLKGAKGKRLFYDQPRQS